MSFSPEAKAAAADKPGMERLAAYLCSLGPLPKQVERVARMCLLDTLGSGIYGASTAEGKCVLRAGAELSQAQDALIWGTGQYAATDQAALINGSLCHMRELDDVHFSILHTGAVCVPAALAVAQRQRCDLAQVLRAVTLGVEAIVRVSLGMDYLSHRRRGWHATATTGAFGAAAATASLLGLDERALADAMGISGSRTGGSWAFSLDNAMSKRIHPGLAAKDGIISAYLAAQGISGPHYVLEAASGGFYQAYSDSWDLAQLDRATERYAIQDVEYKWFASCKSVHSPHAAALSIYHEHPARKPEDIRQITVEVNSSAWANASGMYEPDSVISAQLSIPFGIALGLYGRQGQATDYEPQSLQNSSLFRLASKVRVVISEEMDALRKAELKSGAILHVEWQDGQKAQAKVSTPKGTMANPLSQEDIIYKFKGLTEHIIGKNQTAALIEMILNGPRHTPVSELCALLIPHKIN